ncbi:hypothetical protein, partial [Tumebacillus flagellatus]|uniref:hypothetical protein n=1 Tax=Tumebacillus flagellatus TaxID=1157490 RepID=UPI000571B280
QTIINLLTQNSTPAAEMIKANARATINTTNAARYGVQAILLLNAEQAARIAEQEKQVQTAPIRSLIAKYDDAEADFDEYDLFNAMEDLICKSYCWIDPDRTDFWTAWHAWSAEGTEFRQKSKMYIDQIRAAIGMEKPDIEEEVEQG